MMRDHTDPLTTRTLQDTTHPQRSRSTLSARSLGCFTSQCLALGRTPYAATKGCFFLAFLSDCVTPIVNGGGV